MNRAIATLSIIALLGLAAGCSGEPTDTLTTDEATLALNTTVLALDNVDIALAEGTVEGNQITATASCTAGGSASVDGQFDGESTLSVDVAFDACTENGTTIDGALSYDGTFSESQIILDMNGILEFSGEVMGRCLIDIHMEIGEELGVSMRGSVCGQSIEALLEQQQQQ